MWLQFTGVLSRHDVRVGPDSHSNSAIAIQPQMRSCVTTVVCYNKDAAVSPARLARGLVSAYNERPHGDSKVPPYSVKARLGLMRSALAGVHCD